VRNAQQAVEWARQQHTIPTGGWSGWCLRFSRNAWQLPALYPDAITAWRQTPTQHRHTWSSRPPAGAVVYWEGGAHGHIAISDGTGYVYTTDYPRKDFVGHVRIGTIEQAWGMTPLGWCDYLNGSMLPLTVPRPDDPPAPGTTQPLPIKTKGEPMLIHKTTGNDSWWILAGTALVNISNDEAKTWTGERLTVSKGATWDAFTRAYRIG
jgi:hypothetical protein